MHKLLIVLACVASLAAAGVLDTHRIWNDDNSVERIGTDRITRMSRDELLRQKFLLDVLQHVQQPLVNEELLALADTLIVDSNRYTGQIDEEMLHIIELGRQQRLLGRQEIFSIANDDHLRQMIGLYRLLVCARDWQTVQRNLAWARKNVNGVLLVNAVILAVRDRHDTQMLIMPAIQEILPDLYHDDEIVRKVRTLAESALITDTATVRPGLMDLFGLSDRRRLLNPILSKERQQLGVLGRAQLWMPWHEMRMEMAMRRNAEERGHIMLHNEDKLIVPVTTVNSHSIELITEDVGLKAFLHGLVISTLLQEHESVHLGGNMDRRDHDITERMEGLTEHTELNMNRNMLERERLHGIWGDERRHVGTGMGIGRMGLDNNVDIEHGIDRIGRVGLQHDINMNERLHDWQLSGEATDRLPTTSVDSDRLLHVGRRRQQVAGNIPRTWENDHKRFLQTERGQRTSINKKSGDDNILGERQLRHINDEDINDDDRMETRRTWGNQRNDGRIGIWERKNMVDNMRRGMSTVEDLPTTHVDDERLLHINRRRLNQQTNERDNTWGNNRRIDMTERHRIHDIDTDDMRMHGKGWEHGISNDHDIWGRNNLEDERTIHGKSIRPRLLNVLRGMWGTGRDTSLENTWGTHRVTTTNENLPTTHINDGRLLHMNRRRRLNQREWQREDDSMERGEERDIWGTGHRGDITNRRMDINTDDLTGIHRQHWEQNENLKRNRMDDRVMNEMHGRHMNVHNMHWENSDEDSSEERERVWEQIVNDEKRRTKNNARGMGNIGDIDREEHTQGGAARGGISLDMLRRRIVNGRENNMHTDRISAGMGVGMDIGRRQRIPRSPTMNDERSTSERHDIRAGELVLHNIQQIIARINVERIAHGINQVQHDDMSNIMSQRLNNPRLINAEDQRQILRLNEMRLGVRRDRQILERINELEQRLRTVMEENVRRMIGGQRDVSARDHSTINDLLGDVLIGRQVRGLSLMQMLRDIVVKTEGIRGRQTLLHLGVDLNDICIQHLMARMLSLINEQNRLLGVQRTTELRHNTVKINDVLVDKLRTHIDVTDTDLTNLLNTQLTRNQGRIHRMVMARHQRLNHKSFNIQLNIESEHSQRVVVRTILLPKVDATGRQLTTDEQRWNALMIDAHIVNLKTGRNTIKRKSRDIEWTARDTTPVSEIYQRIMLAIDGSARGMEDIVERVSGWDCRFPHRLLLPRGHVDGFPMQLLVIITPIEDLDRSMQNTVDKRQMCGIGIGSINLDGLPLNFPMDRKIDNMQELANLPNVIIKDIIIQHDDKLRTN